MMTNTTPASDHPRHVWFFAYCLGLAFFCCLLLLVGAALMTRTLPYFHGKPLPRLTMICLDYRRWLLAFPLPWLAAAARHLRRRDAQALQLVKFSATLALALITLSLCVVLALMLPWLPLYLC